VLFHPVTLAPIWLLLYHATSFNIVKAAYFSDGVCTLLYRQVAIIGPIDLQ
jgi:hypothetical protein